MNKLKLKEFKKNFLYKEPYSNVSYNINKINEFMVEFIGILLEEDKEIKPFEEEELKEYIIEHIKEFYVGGIPPNTIGNTIMRYRERIMAKSLKDAERVAENMFSNIISIIEVK